MGTEKIAGLDATTDGSGNGNGYHETAAPETVQSTAQNGTIPFHDLSIIRDEHNEEWLSHAHPSDWQNPTPASKYNLVVIGAGSGGMVAAVGAAGLGAKVALIERHFMGGDCLNAGCVPSKSIIRSARVIGEINRASEYGVTVPEGTTANFKSVMERMRKIRAGLSHHDSVYRISNELGIDMFIGEGRFVDEETIEVESDNGEIQQLKFAKAALATGARPIGLPIPGLSDVGYLTNESIFFELNEQPKRLAVIGGGPIGAEMTQTFQRLGSQVTLFDVAPQILIREDQDAARIVQESFANDGVQFALGAKISEITKSSGGKVIHYEIDGEKRETEFDDILVAVGRAPNIEKLNLEAAGIDYHRRGVTVDDTMLTTNPNVYAVGDIAIKYQFTHVADATARIMLQNALFPGPKKKASDMVVPWCTYTDPEIAHVGMYEKDADEQGIEVETFMQSMEGVDRALAEGDTEGFVKVHVKKGTDKILGATIVASHAGEMISELGLAITAGIGLKTLATVIHPYPTQAEAIKKVADQYNRTRLTPTAARVLKGWLSWARR